MSKRRHLESQVCWVCDDCLMKLANDDTSGYEGPDPSVLMSRFEDGEHVAPGIGWDAHECGHAVADLRDGTHECDCETIDFSPAECAGCSDPLAGRRSAVTVTMWSDNYED